MTVCGPAPAMTLTVAVLAEPTRTTTTLTVARFKARLASVRASSADGVADVVVGAAAAASCAALPEGEVGTRYVAPCPSEAPPARTLAARAVHVVTGIVQAVPAGFLTPFPVAPLHTLSSAFPAHKTRLARLAPTVYWRAGGVQTVTTLPATVGTKFPARGARHVAVRTFPAWRAASDTVPVARLAARLALVPALGVTVLAVPAPHTGQKQYLANGVISRGRPVLETYLDTADVPESARVYQSLCFSWK